jgi:hypothetical protein
VWIFVIDVGQLYCGHRLSFVELPVLFSSAVQEITTVCCAFRNIAIIMTPKDTYLIVYNLCCCVGWSTIFALTILTLLKGIPEDGLKEALANVYNSTENLGSLLFFTQTAAVLEIVHAAIGLVRSPVIVTSMQVSSRIWALLAVTYSPNAQSKLYVIGGNVSKIPPIETNRVSLPSCQLLAAQWGAGLMILSWSIVEIFRYLFYASALVTGDSTKKTPFSLFWLRYSLFAVLYPTGITGELTCFFHAAYDPIFGDFFISSQVAFWIYARILPFIYVFGSPFMIANMAGNRKSAFRKRFAKPPPPPRGIVFPMDATGKPSSTPVNKEILAAAVEAVNPSKAQKIRNAKGYRFTYVKHLIGLVEEQCQSPEACLKIAQAGLEKAYDTFEFVSPDGSAVSVREAMAAKNSERFHTGFIQGQGTAKADGMEIPYKDTILKGQSLKDQVKRWIDYGTIESSAGEAIIGCVDNPKWCDLSNQYFVLLGAGSAMGPLLVLLSLGANVIAIDLDRPFIWKRLIELTRTSTGSITFPLKKEQTKLDTDDDLYAEAGCNLFTHTPMIRDWLMDLYKGKKFTVGSYAYLNGALHVQVSLAMDAIVKDLSEKRAGTSLAYLCTPTDLHLVPKEAWDASIQNFKEYNRKLLCKSSPM